MFRSAKAPSFLVKLIKHTSKPASHVLTKQNKCSGYTLATSPHIFGLAKCTVSILYFSVLKVLPPPLTKGRAVPDCACVHINPSC